MLLVWCVRVTLEAVQMVRSRWKWIQCCFAPFSWLFSIPSQERPKKGKIFAIKFLFSLDVLCCRGKRTDGFFESNESYRLELTSFGLHGSWIQEEVELFAAWIVHKGTQSYRKEENVVRIWSWKARWHLDFPAWPHHPCIQITLWNGKTRTNYRRSNLEKAVKINSCLFANRDDHNSNDIRLLASL